MLNQYEERMNIETKKEIKLFFIAFGAIHTEYRNQLIVLGGLYSIARL
jgi:hypothetical protein